MRTMLQRPTMLLALFLLIETSTAAFRPPLASITRCDDAGGAGTASNANCGNAQYDRTFTNFCPQHDALIASNTKILKTSLSGTTIDVVLVPTEDEVSEAARILARLNDANLMTHPAAGDLSRRPAGAPVRRRHCGRHDQ